jgi:hypothetical protein
VTTPAVLRARLAQLRKSNAMLRVRSLEMRRAHLEEHRHFRAVLDSIRERVRKLQWKLKRALEPVRYLGFVFTGELWHVLMRTPTGGSETACGIRWRKSAPARVMGFDTRICQHCNAAAPALIWHRTLPEDNDT